MRRSKKFILISVLAIVVLGGSISGVALAQTDSEESQPAPRHGAMLGKVCEIYETNTGVAINSEELQKAFDQARSEIMAEARENFRQRLIEEGKITQEQLDEFDAWMESMPDVPFAPGPRGHFGMHRGFGGLGGGFRIFGGPCAPQTTE